LNLVVRDVVNCQGARGGGPIDDYVHELIETRPVDGGVCLFCGRRHVDRRESRDVVRCQLDVMVAREVGGLVMGKGYLYDLEEGTFLLIAPENMV
jgi:hypothetical protein